MMVVVPSCVRRAALAGWLRRWVVEPVLPFSSKASKEEEEGRKETEEKEETEETGEGTEGRGGDGCWGEVV